MSLPAPTYQPPGVPAPAQAYPPGYGPPPGVYPPAGVSTTGVTHMVADPDAVAPVPPGLERWLCRVRTPNPGRVFSFTLAGVSFEHRRQRTFSKRLAREPMALAPTHDLAPARVELIQKLMPMCLLRRGSGVVKPRKMPDGTYVAPTRVDGDEPLAPYVDFAPYVDPVDAGARLAAMAARVAALEEENTILRAERAKERENAAAIEEEETDAASTRAARSTGPRHSKKGASGEVPGGTT